ncbi:uncharacterized protein LOC122376289 [Amphibalanus amphitrite]|uniref:uncharacterized protein LOC122376289 n=1 Tax=Amphibalanus amphitrite TaxID=1232801 RepID=UPI001C904A86|nr:uncharacterized protein LOC122376289 [Amphibalanus amphitrite]
MVNTLRDTGCSTVVVKREFVKDEELTGETSLMLLIDNTVRRVPVAMICVNTPFLIGKVKALCLPDAVYDLIIGQVPGARAPNDPDPEWRATEPASQTGGAAITRAQSQKGRGVLRQSDLIGGTTVTRDELIKLQQEDETLKKLTDGWEARKREGKMRVALDLNGPIHPPSEEGHRYILTLVDYATRYPEAVPLKTCTAEAVAEALIDLYSRLGVPDEMLTDLGRQFVSNCMEEVSELLNIRHLTTTPYHPMCNGLVEKFNGTLQMMLKRLSSEQPRLWHRYINALLFAYREVPQESTGFSPFELLYGRTVRGPMRILRELWTSESETAEVKTSYQYVFELRERLEDTMALAQKELGKAQSRYKYNYDRKARNRKLEAGDKVLILLPSTSNKLLMQWQGPYSVQEKTNECDYRIIVNGKVKTYHINMLKRYMDRTVQENRSDVSASVSGALMEVVAVAVIERSEAAPEEAIEDDDLLEFVVPGGNESLADVQIGEGLSRKERLQAQEVIKTYHAVFSDKPGRTKLIEHRIEVTSPQPIRCKPYPLPYSMRESLREDIRNMLDMGVIRQSRSPYAAPVVLVRKKDGSNRVCVDYRKLNQVTIVDPEPMIKIEDVFQGLGKDRYFSKIDLSRGYWQFPVREEDVQKIGFVTPDGEYEFLRMPFGMVNSGATLVRGVRKLLEGLPNITAYIDDILVHTKTWEEHVSTLNVLLHRMQEAELTARPSKCVIGMACVEFVGHRIGRGVVTAIEDNVSRILEAPKPRTKTELRSFLGLANFYRNYIPDFAAVAVPLTDLTRKGSPRVLQWGAAQDKAFDGLKGLLASRPILRLPEMDKQFVLRTDASDKGIGAVLLQSHDGDLFPVSYASKKLSERERKYSTMERECLAVVWGVRKFQLYLYGRPFVLQTDHQPLVFLNKAKLLNDRIMRWALFLESYRMHIMAIKGADNVEADYMSRAV